VKTFEVKVKRKKGIMTKGKTKRKERISTVKMVVILEMGRVIKRTKRITKWK